MDKKRIKAIEHQKAYHAKLKRAFGKNIKVKEFKVGDLVLKENINETTTNDEVKENLSQNGCNHLLWWKK